MISILPFEIPAFRVSCEHGRQTVRCSGVITRFQLYSRSARLALFEFLIQTYSEWAIRSEAPSNTGWSASNWRPSRGIQVVESEFLIGKASYLQPERRDIRTDRRTTRQFSTYRQALNGRLWCTAIKTRQTRRARNLRVKFAIFRWQRHSLGHSSPFVERIDRKTHTDTKGYT